MPFYLRYLIKNTKTTITLKFLTHNISGTGGVSWLIFSFFYSVNSGSCWRLLFLTNYFRSKLFSLLFYPVFKQKISATNSEKTNIGKCGQNEVEPYASACPACCRRYLSSRCFWWYRSGNNKMTRVFLLDAMRNYVCLWLLCPLLFSPSKLHRVLRIIWIIGKYFEETGIKHFNSSISFSCVVLRNNFKR